MRARGKESVRTERTSAHEGRINTRKGAAREKDQREGRDSAREGTARGKGQRARIMGNLINRSN